MSISRPRFTFAILLFVTAVALSGCSGQPESNSSPTVTDTTTSSPTSPISTPSNGPDVAVASEFTRLKAGETSTIQYRGNKLDTSYTSTSESVQIQIEFQGTTTTITRDKTAPVESVSRSLSNLQVMVTPVVAEERDGQTVYVLAESWDAQYIEVKVFCQDSC